MWGLVREHLVAKIALVLIATLAIGFGVPAILNARLQAREMERLNAMSAEALARGLHAGVRTAMLAGNGLTARNMVEDARARLQDAVVRIYAPSGEEVFGSKPLPPTPEQMPTHVRDAIASGDETSAPGGASAHPISNEDRCRGCHPDGELRAVLTIGTDGATVALDDGDHSLDALNTVVGSAFVQLMTAGKEDGLDAYFAEIRTHATAVTGVAVLDSDGARAFGSESIAVDPAVFSAAMRAGEPQSVVAGDVRLRVQPLRNAPQCHACHEPEPTMRGAIVTALRPGAAAPRETLVRVSDVSLRHVMLAGLGRLIARFLDAVVETGTVSTLTLHDAEGRLFRDALARPEPPPMVREALDTASQRARTVVADGAEHFTFVAPLRNDSECQRCHGSDSELRGAIEVVLDTTASAASRRELIETGLFFGLGTIALTLGVLYMGLRMLVVRPVAEIGDVAERVGGGHLDARVRVHTIDEIGRLGARLNQMIVELRKKLELAKFVSQATYRSVDAAESGVQRVGERTRMTVLFSDIRGFTGFSETVSPEQVVEALNRYLEAQAAVVQRHGGDIDKFVGDELMAHFRGDDMERRAVACAVEMLEAVEALNAALSPGSDRLQVGIGVNVGDMIFGAMGAQSRMDFTVIGDAVNLGSRLCSAALPGQVVVSAPVRDACGDVSGIAFDPLEPISVKGKRQPIAVFAARRR